MKYLSLVLLIKTCIIQSQSADSIKNELNRINQSIKDIVCEKGQILSNRGMNLFVGDRVGYYLADHENLTFCKNNVTLNSANGIFSMSHSLFEPTRDDLPIKSYNVIGLKTNVFNAFQAATNKVAFNNELGFTYKHFWLSKPNTTLHNCYEKEAFDAKRTIILSVLEREILEKTNSFQKGLSNIQHLSDTIKKELGANFFTSLKEEYSRKFAELQSNELFETMRFKSIKMNWTNFNIYIPVIRQRYSVVEDLNSNFEIKKSYPAEITISHTRFIEKQNATKIYVNFRAGLFANNSVNSRILNWVDFETYKNMGGKNISYLINKQLERVNIGKFKNFLTPNLKVQLIYFPPENHFGISAAIEQNFGLYNATNGTIGIPVVLIDKAGLALSNFEVQIRYFDMTNSLKTGRSFKDDVSIGLTWGQAIGRKVY